MWQNRLVDRMVGGLRRIYLNLSRAMLKSIMILLMEFLSKRHGYNQYKNCVLQGGSPKRHDLQRHANGLNPMLGRFNVILKTFPDIINGAAPHYVSKIICPPSLCPILRCGKDVLKVEERE